MRVRVCEKVFICACVYVVSAKCLIYLAVLYYDSFLYNSNTGCGYSQLIQRGGVGVGAFGAIRNMECQFYVLTVTSVLLKRDKSNVGRYIPFVGPTRRLHQFLHMLGSGSSSRALHQRHSPDNGTSNANNSTVTYRLSAERAYEKNGSAI